MKMCEGEHLVRPKLRPDNELSRHILCVRGVLTSRRKVRHQCAVEYAHLAQNVAFVPMPHTARQRVEIHCGVGARRRWRHFFEPARRWL